MTRFAIGVDLGGTNLRVGAINENGAMFDQMNLETLSERGREDVVDRLTGGILELVARWKQHYTLVGIGVGVPGIIKLDEGVVVASPNLPGWENFNIRAQIFKRLNSPIFLDNDANAAALGEKWMGVGKDVQASLFADDGDWNWRRTDSRREDLAWPHRHGRGIRACYHLPGGAALQVWKPGMPRGLCGGIGCCHRCSGVAGGGQGQSRSQESRWLRTPIDLSVALSTGERGRSVCQNDLR